MQLMLAQTFSNERAKWRAGLKKYRVDLGFLAPASKDDSGSDDSLNTNDTHCCEWLTLIVPLN
jgi:hypothetical protein